MGHVALNLKHMGNLKWHAKEQSREMRVASKDKGGTQRELRAPPYLTGTSTNVATIYK